MSKQTTESKTLAKPLTDDEIWAKICLTGNLAGLSDQQRLMYYERYCAYLGLDPITRPFDLITTYETGPLGEKVEKTILYANAGCAAQLAEKRGITYGEPKTEYDAELGTVTISVKAFQVVTDVPRSCWRRGVAHVSGMKGKWLENAIKKAETQAHRRATLAFCGVAMPDESEIDDIEGAQESAIIPAERDDKEVGNIIGTYIQAAGMQDSPAERGFVLEGLRMGAFQAVAQRLKVPVDVIFSLEKRRKMRFEVKPPIVAEAMREAIAEELDAAHERLEDLRLDEAATRVESSLDTAEKVEALKRAIAPDLEAAREKLDEAARVEQEIKDRRAEARKVEEGKQDDDAIAGLVVTLSETHQKVSDRVADVIKTYKRQKAEVLRKMSEFLRREVTRAADLSDDEAACVLKWLDSWLIKLKKNAKCGPPTGFDQTLRNHDDEVGKRLDYVYRRLTSLGVHGQAMLDKMQEILVSMSKPVTTTRYALDDDGAIQVCEIFEDWANDLAQISGA